MTLAITYILYLLISVGLTVWVARTLQHNGRAFLIDAFEGKEDLADSVNHLLVVGFYLVNIGFVTLALKFKFGEAEPHDLKGAIEFLSFKVGGVLLVLGVMHFGNLFVFNRVRRKAMLHAAPPPVAPDELIDRVVV